MARPLFRKGVEELEQLFREWRNSPENLKVLAEELTHRERPRALRLRKQVEEALKSPISTDEEPAHLGDTDSEADKETRPADGRSEAPPKRGQQSTPAADGSESFQHFAAPDHFTLVQPLGTRPRPNAYRPTLENDVRLPLSKDDPPVKVFRVAIAELIREMRRRHLSHQQFTLEDGERLATEAGGFSYQFEFVEEAHIFEGAKVEIIIGGRVVTGHLTGISQGRIIVTLQEDFGAEISTCILRIDNTALLQALHDRLEKIEKGEVPSFRAEFAGCVLKNAGAEQPGRSSVQWPWPEEQPTPDQRRFVDMAITNEIAWLWGPPGTGKTVTLSALTRLLYEDGKRVLICSNTNQAVDQLLLKLCRKMRDTNDPALEDGRVIRLGNIEDDLEAEFGDYIVPEQIVQRKSEALVERKAEIERELERLGREIAYAEEMLSRFAKLDAARGFTIKAAQNLQGAAQQLQQARSDLAAIENRQQHLATELQEQQQAGAVRRVFMRGEATIRRELVSQGSRAETAKKSLDAANHKLTLAQADNSRATTELQNAEQAVIGEDKAHYQELVAAYDTKRQPLRDELASVASKLEDIRNAILREARIVGATVTRTFLRPIEFSAFDSVIVDEASMILLPAVFQAAGLATERVVIAGDFQQLPPIVQTQQQSIHDVLAHDVFAEAGISIGTVRSGKTSRLVWLKEQHRMDDSICQVVSTTFYGGELATHHTRLDGNFEEPEPLSQRITIIDTSRVWPFTTRNVFNSRFNLMHALAVRNLVLHLKESERIIDERNKSRIGICTPYAAQAKLLRAVLKGQAIENAEVRASTVHGFQGDERALMILDLVDSVGERNVGIFLQANQLEDSGAKLLNVALSRAQEGLVIVANLTFLDEKLPSDAILRGILHDLQRKGRIVDVKEVLALRPILEDLNRFGNQPSLDPECLRTGLFGGRDFARLCRFDMENAEQSIVVFSGFITPERAAQMGDLFRLKIADGVKVRCVTRSPKYNGSIPEEQGRAALAALESLGVAIDLRSDIHEKVVLIDNRIVWFGSLNPLSHTARTSELMARVDSEGVAEHVASILSVRRRSSEESGNAADPENPRCESCGGWSVLIRGRYGLFFRCASSCDWTQDVNATRRSRVEKPVMARAQLTDIGCEKCGKPMSIRSSARGQFLGCSGYPKCRNAKPLPSELASMQPAAAPAAAENAHSEERCPKCHSPMVMRSGRFGNFLACSAYPKCKTTKKIQPTA